MNMDFNDIKDSIIKIIIENDILEKENIFEKIGEKTNLFDNGLNSLGVVELIVEIEECFDLEFLDEELNLDNFKDIISISNVVYKKVNANEC